MDSQRRNGPDLLSGKPYNTRRTDLDISCKYIHIMHVHDMYCEEHNKLRAETPLSPPKYNCKHCGKRKIYGHTNPNHGSNPFGYLYLVPVLCENCSIQLHRCMWCSYTANT